MDINTQAEQHDLDLPSAWPPAAVGILKKACLLGLSGPRMGTKLSISLQNAPALLVKVWPSGRNASFAEIQPVSQPFRMSKSYPERLACVL